MLLTIFFLNTRRIRFGKPPPRNIGIFDKNDYERLIENQSYQIGAIDSLLEFFRTLNFEKFGEIGGIPFIHAQYLLSKFQNKSAVLTDRSDVYLQPFRELNLIPNASFEVYDLHSSNLQIFIDCQFIMLWGVDLFYSDTELKLLFQFCRTNGIKLLMGSRNVENWKWEIRRMTTLWKVFTPPKGTYTGAYRSRAYFRKLAQTCNLETSDLGHHSIYRVLLLQPKS